MANYNTKGKGRRQDRKDFDTMYNAGYVWNDKLFDMLVKGALSKSNKLNVSRHVQDRVSEDYYGNRLFSPDDITLYSLREGTPVECEFQLDYYDDEDCEMLRKAVIRLPERDDGEQVCVVCLFNPDKAPVIKTAWLNKKDDNHQTGLDTSEFEWKIYSGKYGYYHGRFKSDVWDFDGFDKMTRVNSNHVLTEAQYKHQADIKSDYENKLSNLQTKAQDKSLSSDGVRCDNLER